MASPENKSAKAPINIWVTNELEDALRAEVLLTWQARRGKGRITIGTVTEELAREALAARGRPVGGDGNPEKA